MLANVFLRSIAHSLSLSLSLSLSVCLSPFHPLSMCQHLQARPFVTAPPTQEQPGRERETEEDVCHPDVHVIPLPSCVNVRSGAHMNANHRPTELLDLDQR